MDGSLLVGVIASLLSTGVLVAAVTRMTTLSAFTQMGSLQERMAPWASLTHPKASPTTTDSTTSSPALSPRAASKMSFDVHTKDKIIFTLNVLNVGLTCYIMGAFPQYFYLWHTPKAIYLTGLRWYTFHKNKQHYLLYDFCYWANLLSLIYTWVYPHSPEMFQILFMVSNGPLAWSVLAFSQSLIFHSLPHMTSVFIHVSPMLLTHAIRWYPGKHYTVCEDFPQCNVAPTTLLFNANFKFYVWWCVIYYLWVFVALRNRVKSRGYQTLYDRVIKQGATKWLSHSSQYDLVKKLYYVLTHFVFANLTMCLAVLHWYYWYAHVVFMLAICTTAAWNAAGFYFTALVRQAKDEKQQQQKTEEPKKQ